MGDTGLEWKVLATDPEVRLRAVRGYAELVLGGPVAAERWLRRSDLAVRSGTCSVLTACESTVGFFEAMAELARVSQFREREARKRASLREREVTLTIVPWQRAENDMGRLAGESSAG